jgi:hypothetical protein
MGTLDDATIDRHLAELDALGGAAQRMQQLLPVVLGLGVAALVIAVIALLVALLA